MAAGSLALAAACALRVAQGAATFYDLSLRTEARGRNRAATAGVTGEVEAVPYLALSWLDQRVELGIAYGPRLMIQEDVGRLQTLHRGAVSGSLVLDGGWRAGAAAQGSYGTNNFLVQGEPTLATAPAQPAQAAPVAPRAVQPLPQLTTLNYVSGETSINAEGALAPRYRFAARLAGFVEGGADAVARSQMPLQRGGRLDADLGWTVTGLDELTSSLTGTASFFENGIEDEVVSLAEMWRHALRSGGRVRVGAGAAVTVNSEGGHTFWGLLPTAELGLEEQWLRDVEVDLALRATAMIDRITGAVYERADATGVMRWRIGLRWVVSASGSGGIVVDGLQAGDRIGTADVRAAWTPITGLELSIGARAFVQLPHAQGVADISEATAFFAVSAGSRDRL